jgi:hypothetical protein
MEPRVPGKQFLGKYAGGKLAQAVVGQPRSNASSKSASRVCIGSRLDWNDTLI